MQRASHHVRACALNGAVNFSARRTTIKIYILIGGGGPKSINMASVPAAVNGLRAATQRVRVMGIDGTVQ
jgi:hypothetical protein